VIKDGKFSIAEVGKFSSAWKEIEGEMGTAE